MEVTQVGDPLLPTYNGALVLLSFLVAILGSYTATDLTGQVALARGRVRGVWLAGGIAALGISIWAMHFIAMLAYRLPIPVSYDFTMVVVSMLVAINGSGVGLFIVTRRQPATWRMLLAAGVSVGLAIIGMHFTGMAATQVAAMMEHATGLILLSAAVAVGGSGAALSIAFRPAGVIATEVGRRIGVAFLLGAAIAGMHYIAMAAVTFRPVGPTPVTLDQAGSDPALLATAVGVATSAVLVLGLLGSLFGRRLSAQLAHAEALTQSERRFRSLVQHASDIVIIAGADRAASYISPSLDRILGHRPEDWSARDVLDLVHPDDRARVERLLADVDRPSGVNARAECRLRHADGSWRHFDLVVVNLLAEPSVAGIVVTCHDVTARKRGEAQLVYDALHDVLTGLPNRALLMDRVGQAWGRAGRRQGYAFAVLLADIDRFKLVNDSLGHAVGDHLLVRFARRLEPCLRAGDTVARLGADEFGILMDDVRDVGDATAAAERILAALGRPFVVDGHEVVTSVSIGIALGTNGREGPAELLRNAGLAKDRAKANVGARFELFDAAMHLRALERLQLEGELRRAADLGQLRPYYQPIVDLRTNRIAGFEALVRWQHPERGLLTPSDFLQVAEETGLIVRIGDQVLREACHQLRAWQRRLGLALTMSVNVGGRELAEPELAGGVERLLHEAGLPGSAIVVEVTDGVVMEQAEATEAKLLRLRDLGVVVCIDDFGTGHSSLSRLHRLPIDRLKIDRSFVSRLPADGLEIVRAIVALANGLELEVTAEGVETAEQLAVLRDLGCEYGQGHLFSPAVDADAAEALLAAPPPRLGGLPGLAVSPDRPSS